MFNRALYAFTFAASLAGCLTEPSSSTSSSSSTATITSDDKIVDVCGNPNEKKHCRAKVHARALEHRRQPAAIPAAPPATDGFGPSDLASAYNFNPALK